MDVCRHHHLEHTQCVLLSECWQHTKRDHKESVMLGFLPVKEIPWFIHILIVFVQFCKIALFIFACGAQWLHSFGAFRCDCRKRSHSSALSVC